MAGGDQEDMNISVIKTIYFSDPEEVNCVRLAQQQWFQQVKSWVTLSLSHIFLLLQQDAKVKVSLNKWKKKRITEYF